MIEPDRSWTMNDDVISCVVVDCDYDYDDDYDQFSDQQQKQQHQLDDDDDDDDDNDNKDDDICMIDGIRPSPSESIEYHIEFAAA